MKKAILTLLLMVTSMIGAMSQTTINYVVHSEIQKDIMYLYMDPTAYELLSEISKSDLFKEKTRENDIKMVYVISGHHGELWQKINESFNMIDNWDMDKPEKRPVSDKKTSTGRSLERPWFFNLSGAFGTIKSEGSFMINNYGYSRVGCYLLQGRWDIAINGLLGYSKISGGNDGSKSGSMGVDTRAYILKGKVVNPFAGIGLSYSSSSGESSLIIPVSVGAIIPINGKGCIDACYQYNKVTKSTFIVGYTFMR